jgi:hypothetical protein
MFATTMAFRAAEGSASRASQFKTAIPRQRPPKIRAEDAQVDR